MAERSEEEVILGLLRIELGDRIRTVPTLKAKYVGDWMALLAPPGGASDKPLGEWSEADVLTVPTRNAERLADLVVAYDRTGALPGREWLLENADPAQLHAAVVAMLENANPLANAPALLGLMLLRAVAGSEPPSSTSGASRSGASTRTRSASDSTTSSSSGSGRPASSGSRRSTASGSPMPS